MEVLDLIKSMDASRASIKALFGGEGVPLQTRNATLARKDPAKYYANLKEVALFYDQVYKGHRPLHHLQEALSVSDFSFLFADILDRQMLGKYREYPSSIMRIARVATVNDFRTVKRRFVDGSESQLEQVPRQSPYPESSLSDGEYGYSVQKYGCRIGIDWETKINDDLDAFRDIPDRFAKRARRTEQKFITTLFCDANGPHATHYTGGNNNLVTGQPALSQGALKTAWDVFNAQKDADNEPIFFEKAYLVVPPALEILAFEILRTSVVERQEGSSGDGQVRLRTENYFQNRLEVIVDPYIPIVASSANGNTSWWIFGEPTQGRPAMEIGFLRNHREPEIWVKEPNARRLGGGAVDPLEGSFEDDTMSWRLRTVHGGTFMDVKTTVASNGTG